MCYRSVSIIFYNVLFHGLFYGADFEPADDLPLFVGEDGFGGLKATAFPTGENYLSQLCDGITVH